MNPKLCNPIHIYMCITCTIQEYMYNCHFSIDTSKMKAKKVKRAFKQIFCKYSVIYTDQFVRRE